MAAVSPQKMSDERMLEATGRVRADWHAFLDAAGARDWAHPRIARWLVEEHGVDGWWAQGITVGFEQAIGRRLPGQSADGTFAISEPKPGKTLVSLTRSRILDGERLDTAKGELRDILDRLGSSGGEQRVD